MSGGRWRGPLLIGVVVLVVAAGAAFANVALLSSTGEDDRLGKLRPTATALTAPGTGPTGTEVRTQPAPGRTGTTTPVTPAPTVVITDDHPPSTTDDDDDDSGHGRGRGRGRGGDEDD